MPIPWRRLGSRIEAAERWLALPSSRLFLSSLIILSVLPEAAQAALLPAAVVARLPWIFLLIFGLELLVRVVILCNHWLQRRAAGWEVILLVLDLVAVISFLPLESHFDASSLRLVRLTRLLLLAAYWGDLGKDFLSLLRRRELRNQVVLVLFVGLVLSLVGAVVARHVAPDFDFDGDGEIGDPQDQDFFYVLWWAFRQVQDPGNLVSGIDRPAVVGLSLFLTFAGLLVLALVIGIGTSAIEEMLRRARQRPVALQGHSVILGTTDHDRLLLEGLAQIYLKNLRPFRAAVLGSDDLHDLLDQSSMRRVHLRRGDPIEVEDLERVAVGRARRVLILGSDTEDPDGDVLSAILATRRSNERIDLYPEIDHERNFGAARTAGGPRTHIVGTGSFLGHYLVHQVIYPGSVELYRQLLESSGCEVYTYLYSKPERQRLLRASRGSFDPATLYTRSFFDHGVSVIGILVPPEEALGSNVEEWEDDDLVAILNPIRAAREAAPGHLFDGRGGIHWQQIRGVIGIALRWRDLASSAKELYAASRPSTPLSFPAAAATVLPLALPRRTLGKVAICGGSERIPRVVVELLGFFPALEIEVLVPEESRFPALIRDISAMSTRIRGQSPVIEGEGEVRVLFPEGKECSTGARIALRQVRWGDLYRLLQEDLLQIDDLDTLLFLPATHNHDGAVALDCLHLANLASRGLLRYRSDLHVIGLVRDPAKGELLESRLRKLAPGRSPLLFSIVSSERVRHQYIVQNVFVRGLNTLFLELLSAEGQHVGRLDLAGGRVPLDSIDPEALAGTLLQHDLVLLGLAIDGPEGREVELRVSELADLSRKEGARDLCGVYVLGTRKALEAVDRATAGRLAAS